MLLHTHDLTKFYGDHPALSALTMQMAPGEVVGLLGPNGSGKSTAIRILLGFHRATRGTATVAGHDCWADSVAVRSKVAYLPGELRLYESMTGRQLLRFLGRLRGQDPAPDDLARRFDIDLDQSLTQMSSGMKRKVALIAVLLPDIPLVILDEPTNTLDPIMRDELLTQIQLAKQAGKAVLFSSHVLQEVETVCDRVLILRRGQLVHEQATRELREGRVVSAKLFGPLVGEHPAATVTGVELTMLDRGPLPELLAWLARQPLSDLRIEPMSLTPIYRRFHAGE
ncbi:MAG: ABC transporter ATP-binding protein [Gemmataceae bacterium]